MYTPSETATAEEGTHPTGMHSCFYLNLICDMAWNLIVIAGSFRVSLFIDLACPSDLGKRSGCFMIIRWWSIS